MLPQHRRRGLGGLLVDGFLDWARERGAPYAVVTAFTANPAAIRLYERHGFGLHTPSRGAAPLERPEPRRHLVGQSGLDPLRHPWTHRRQVCDRAPAHVAGLVVRDVGLTRHPGAREREVEIAGAIAVRVDDLVTHAGHGQPVHPDLDTGLLERLADRADRWLLTRVDDPGHRSPRPVVAALDQEQFVAATDDRGDPRQPQQLMADSGAQLQDEVGDRHLVTLGGLRGRPHVGSARRSDRSRRLDCGSWS